MALETSPWQSTADRAAAARNFRSVKTAVDSDLPNRPNNLLNFRQTKSGTETVTPVRCVHQFSRLREMVMKVPRIIARRLEVFNHALRAGMFINRMFDAAAHPVHLLRIHLYERINRLTVLVKEIYTLQSCRQDPPALLAEVLGGQTT